MVQEECGCADPNYPITDAARFKYCDPTDATRRTASGTNGEGRDWGRWDAGECWHNLISSGSQMKNPTTSCTQCQLPCKEGVYDVTVSAASWPAKSTLKIAECNDDDAAAEAVGGCLALYRQNGAMVEVFYEQLNYQLLDESPAYEFVNLASDFGGQIGSISTLRYSSSPHPAPPVQGSGSASPPSPSSSSPYSSARVHLPSPTIHNPTSPLGHLAVLYFCCSNKKNAPVNPNTTQVKPASASSAGRPPSIPPRAT